MNYKVTYRVDTEIKEVVVRDIEKITTDLRIGKGYRSLWADRLWRYKVAEFQDVIAILSVE